MITLNKLRTQFAKCLTVFVYRWIFRGIGNKSIIYKPYLVVNAKYISIGAGCSIRKGLRIEVIDPQSEVVIKIGNNVNIEQNVHIIGRVSVIIGDNVSITGHCSIVDVVHPYQDVFAKEKIASRISKVAYPVYIGDNSVIGFGSHISPGVRIGKNCMIGANAVVTKDIPDYCVAVGNPAKVIKRYDFNLNEWVKEK